MRILALLIFLISVYPITSDAAERYTISDTFDGCEYGKLYALDNGHILECQEYNYFYDYRPEVIADGRQVIVIGDERVDAYIHDGSVIETSISGEFEGCYFDKVYKLQNGLYFSCLTFNYTYTYSPDVKIFLIQGRPPVVFIDGEEYDGYLFKAD